MLTSCAGGLSSRESARVYYNLGNAYFDLGKNSDASSAYLKALEFDDKLKVASFNLARSYIETEKYSDALRILDEMIQEDRVNTILHAAKGYCLYRYGDLDKAASSYLDVIEISPADQNALFNYALIMSELKEYSSAVEHFADLKRTNPDDELLLKKIDFAVGKVYYLQDNYSEALVYFESVFDKDSDYEGLPVYLFDIYKKEKYYEKMIKTGKKILESDPDNNEVLFDMSRVLLLEIEDREQGIEYFRKAVDKGYNNREKIDEILDSRNLSAKDEIEKILKNVTFSDD